MLGMHSAPRAPVWTFVLLGVILLEEQGKANFFRLRIVSWVRSHCLRIVSLVLYVISNLQIP